MPEVDPEQKAKEDGFKAISLIAGVGCCLPIFLLFVFVVGMLFLAFLMNGCQQCW